MTPPLMRPLSSVSRRDGGNEPGGLGTRTAVVAVLGIALFGVLVIRLWSLTVLSGSTYAQKAVDNQLRRIPVEAPRGQIVDRDGRVMVTNRAAQQVVLNLQEVPGAQRPALYHELAAVLGTGVGSIKRAIHLSQIQDPIAPVVVASDETNRNVIFYLREHQSQFPGVAVRDSYVRDYMDATAGAQLFGQIGQVTATQLTGSFANLKSGDLVGQTGLERTYDQYLRGTDGYEGIEVDASGTPQGAAHGVPATPGDTLRLSIDARLEKATQEAIADGLAHAHGSGSGASQAGAAVALDPNTGQVLAMASAPTYDPNIFNDPNDAKQVAKVDTSATDPLLNRAIEGEYPPGSTFKAVTSIAALMSGFVTPSTYQPCTSSITVDGQKFQNFEGEAFGSMDLAQAIEASCDTWFYPLGVKFYDAAGSKLQDWAQKFGLGKITGVDLPGEEPGLVPTEAWRKKTYTGYDRSWRPGDSVNLSIGQGDLLVTPLQMAEVYEAVATGGIIHQPRIGLAIDDPSGHPIQSLGSTPLENLDVPQSYWDTVRQGMELVTHGPDGTGTGVFDNFPVDVAGKTGTAEKGTGVDESWFCGYAPADAPTIVACAIIEHGGQGAYAAAPAVRDIMASYFHVSPAAKGSAG